MAHVPVPMRCRGNPWQPSARDRSAFPCSLPSTGTSVAPRLLAPSDRLISCPRLDGRLDGGRPAARRTVSFCRPPRPQKGGRVSLARPVERSASSAAGSWRHDVARATVNAAHQEGE